MNKRLHRLIIVITAAIMVLACGVFVNAETTITGDAYDCVKCGDMVFCNCGEGIVVVNSQSFEVAKVFRESYYTGNLTTDGRYVYYCVHGEGISNDNFIIRLDPTSLERKKIVSNCGFYEFVVSDSKIYYSYYKSLKSSNNIGIKCVNIDGTDQNTVTGVTCDVTTLNSNDVAYTLQVNHDDYVDWVYILKNNSGELVLGRYNIVNIVYADEMQVYKDGSFVLNSKQIGRLLEYYTCAAKRYLSAEYDDMYGVEYKRISSGKYLIKHESGFKCIVCLYKDGKPATADAIPDIITLEYMEGTGVNPCNDVEILAFLQMLCPSTDVETLDYKEWFFTGPTERTREISGIMFQYRAIKQYFVDDCIMAQSGVIYVTGNDHDDATTPSVAKLKSVKSGKKSFKVTWNKASDSEGYVIQYSTSSKFANAKTKYVKSKATTTTTIGSLKSKKNYYVRVAAYVQYDGQNVRGDWSNTRKIKTK